MNGNFNAQNTPQFGAKFILNCPEGLLTLKQTTKLSVFASNLGHPKNVISLTVDGNADTFTITEAHKVFSGKSVNPMYISKDREYYKFLSGSIFNVCMQRLENVKRDCDSLRISQDYACRVR